MLNQSQLILKMSDYLANDPRRIHHFLKVLGFAQVISSCEQLDPCTATILETAAIVHDIGSKISEAKYGQSNGKLQEQEGPAEALIFHRISLIVSAILLLITIPITPLQA